MTSWASRYPAYNVNTIHLQGVISPESLHLYSFPDWVSPNKQENMRAWIVRHKCTWVRKGHPVMDMIENGGFTSDIEAFNIDGWYHVDNWLLNHCINIIRGTLEKNEAN